MTTIFMKKLMFWLTVSLVWLLGVEATAIGSRSFDQPRKDSSLAKEYRRFGDSSGGSMSATSSRLARDISGEDYSSGTEQQLAGYRFGDEFFNDPSGETVAQQATKTEISGSEAGKKVDGCERVVKDSMICMVCQDPKTRSKYEQCSYVARPQGTIKTYGSSRRYNKEDEGSIPSERRRYSNDDSDETTTTTTTTTPFGRRYAIQNSAETLTTTPLLSPNPRYAGADESSEIPRYYEQAEDDKSFSNDKIRNHPENEYDDDRVGKLSYEQTANTRPIASASLKKLTNDEEISSGGEKQGNCRKVIKDSMTCTICNDPSNGGNFEKCSYRHQPNDRLYKYSKSKSFGYPGSSASPAAQESKRVDKIADSKPSKNYRCQSVPKNSSTICKICQDSVTGAKSEQCEYNLKPSKRQSLRTIDSTNTTTSP
ncbi:uncharacterized protein [Venturia canescens]|uniref:uncharacterized protein n=1 Tax=Venturia canescens TaxID=32260 RepID=UPI001C9C81BC|nr:uncharacterized protein LOC122410772 [Venturia canescens]